MRMRALLVLALCGCAGDEADPVPVVGGDSDVLTPEVDTAVPETETDMELEAVEVVAELPDLAGPCGAEPVASCDGQDDCFTWRLKGIEIPPSAGVASITWEVEAHCAAPLDEVLFAFSPGLTRLGPAAGETYVAPEGSTWTASFEDEGCAGFRLSRSGDPDAAGKTTFHLTAESTSIDHAAVFENRARAGATVGTFATRASTCFVFTR